MQPPFSARQALLPPDQLGLRVHRRVRGRVRPMLPRRALASRIISDFKLSMSRTSSASSAVFLLRLVGPSHRQPGGAPYNFRPAGPPVRRLMRAVVAREVFL